MRTTLILDDELLEKASRLSGVKGKTAVVRAGLQALIARESARRLAALGGTEKRLRSTAHAQERKPLTLVDTSVWFADLRQGDPRLAARLEETEVLTHPFDLGESARRLQGPGQAQDKHSGAQR